MSASKFSQGTKISYLATYQGEVVADNGDRCQIRVGSEIFEAFKIHLQPLGTDRFSQAQPVEETPIQRGDRVLVDAFDVGIVESAPPGAINIKVAFASGEAKWFKPSRVVKVKA